MHWNANDIAVILGATAAFLGAIATATAKILGAIKDYHREVNSRMDQLLTETRRAATAEGKDVGRLEEKARGKRKDEGEQG